MELTGKALEQFEKWYSKVNNRISYKTEDFSGYGLGFTDLPDSMKFGVLVDFFDSVGIRINIHFATCSAIGTSTGYWSEINDKQFHSSVKTRQEARTEAIKKVNEILNEQL